MKFTPTSIPEIIVIEPTVFGDERGYFMETWTQSKFAEGGITAQFVQDNHSKSQQGVLRGLHYQISNAQGKLVRVLKGEVFDVAVDMRKSSPSYGQWVGETLSEENKKMMWVPPGFAHGFYVLSEEAEFVYKCTDYYAPEYERSVLWNDLDIGIEWPLIPGKAPQLSAKDQAGLRFKDAQPY
ncbi:MAG: dTDP-4-dehydrorhamnose 3,5-epimerase [Pseudomonadales bacterium]|nr:dTDP-4-dehydrorhamnose 3,5-epimerase [Pseudomonadales bacterium]